MVVQHNLTAMNSNRMLGITSGTQAKSTEKLSSGYKINRAADDAAGLSISEKMRKQIRGLTQASLNAEDGISAVQTAEGALNEVQDMLQRMNELAVKAANGTMSENDRSYVQNEIDQLVTEIDRVAETTKFNETYLLKGDAVAKVGTADKTATVATNITATLKANSVVTLGDYSLGTVKIASATTGSGTAATTLGTVTASDNAKLASLLDKSTTGTMKLVAAADSAKDSNNKFDDAGALWVVQDGNGNIISDEKFTTAQLSSVLGLSTTNTASSTAGTKGVAAGDSITVSKTLVTSTQQAADLAAQGITQTGTAAVADLAKISVGNDLQITLKADQTGAAEISEFDNGSTPPALTLSLHVGADSTSNNKISVDIKTMSAKGLGLKTAQGEAIKVDGTDSKNADDAINTIAAAIQKVSTQRSALGAVQNRLEHTIANLDNVVENTTAAESQIRDTDMATEMVKYSNNNILAQAGQAMLAQANQANQGVLSLLG